MKNLFLPILLLQALIAFSQDLPKVNFGKIQRVENFKTALITPRNIDIWLPNDYGKSKKYAVVYMHDGQMLFDATQTWNKTAWEADEMMQKLTAENKLKNCIIVAIWNIPEQRYADYFPQKVLENIAEPLKSKILTQQIKVKPNADNYLKFLVTELKPYIDTHFSTKKNAKNTFLMGSSMGGLISIYGLCEYPKVFGGAACLSIHSPLLKSDLIDENTDQNAASKFRNYLVAHLPKANSKKIYFDYGDQTLDALYKPFQIKIDEIMQQKKWKSPYWETHFFAGENHSENAWAKRLDIPFLFLLEKNNF